MCIKINKVGKQEVGIWWIQKRFPRYEVPIWSLCPNIRFVSSIVAEKNVTKNVHICSYRYAILWEAFLDPSDSYFLFADLVGFYTHWTYMHIFRHIFLSNYWWHKSDIWAQASYRYPIWWEVFLDPSDSYFLFVDFVDFYTHWTYMLIFHCIFLSKYWWQKSDISSQATLPTIWHTKCTYMKLVTKYQISAIDSCWEKCDEKYLGWTEGQMDRGRTV
jgi:hypothetical protein